MGQVAPRSSATSGYAPTRSLRRVSDRVSARRSSTSYAYQVLLLEELKQAGIEVHFCERPINDSPDDQLLLQIQGAIAEYERAKILERSRRGRLHQARRGELPSPTVPYGYHYAARKYGGDGKIQIDPDKAAMVHQIFEWYAAEGTCLDEILRRLNASPWKPAAPVLRLGRRVRGVSLPATPGPPDAARGPDDRADPCRGPPAGRPASDRGAHPDRTRRGTRPDSPSAARTDCSRSTTRWSNRSLEVTAPMP